MKNLDIKEFVDHTEADVCGIASIDRFEDSPEGYHPKDILPEAESVVVVGKRFPRSVFQIKSNVPYTMIRNQLINGIDKITLNLTMQLESKGFATVPIPSGEPYEYWDEENRHGRGVLSLKHSAVRAGLGFIGKNTLLIHPEYGNRLWFGAVLTSNKMKPDEPNQKKCPDECQICIDVCPQNALDGTTIDQKKCRQISSASTDGGGWLITCNLCRTKCPYSRV